MKHLNVKFMDTSVSIPDKNYSGPRLKKYLFTMIYKRYPELIELFEAKHSRKCACGNLQDYIGFKDSMELVETPNGILIDCTNITHARDKSYGKYFACGKPGCFLKKLNPNSVEYVKFAYNLNEDDASKLILDRNNSPFYRKNHKDVSSYSTFQSHSGRSACRQNEITANWKLSYYRNKNKFISKNGIGKWNELQRSQRSIFDPSRFSKEEICKRKSRVKPKPKFVNGEINETWIQSNYASFVNDENKFKGYCLDLIGKNMSIIGFCLVLQRAEDAYISKNPAIDKKVSRVVAFKHTFKILNLFEYFDIPQEVRIRYKNFVAKNSYSYSSSVDGHFFRSALELDMYTSLKAIEDVVVIDTNKKYPGKLRKFYDIKIRYHGEEYYIELCSFNSKAENLEYCNNVEYKALKFRNCVLVYNVNKFINDLKQGKEVSNEYY